MGDAGQKKYKAFISYSFADKQWGDWLHRALEVYRTPKPLVGKQTPIGPVPRRLHPIFKDREEEAASAGITVSIEQGLDKSEFLIVICSPRSAQSKWVNHEVAYFKQYHDPAKILTLIVDGEPGASFMPDREAEECFPQSLLFKVDENLTVTDEAEDAPLGADARKTGDGKRLAKLKIAAALLGVGLDDLVKREDRRRAIRRRITTAVLASLSIVFAGLSWVANDQRIAAVKARAQAESARVEAEFRRDEAEGLIEFMLTDLRQRLDAVGRLDILDSTAERSLAYYAKQDAESLDPDALGRRARAQLLAGEVHNLKGDLDNALTAYEQAAATTGEQLRRDPGNEQRIFDHSQSVFWVGYIAWQRGDAEKAREQLNQYHDLAQKLVEVDPDNDDWQAELEYSYSNLGTLEMDQGNAAAAELQFRKSLEVSSRLAEKYPDDVERILAAGQSYAWWASSLHSQTKLEGAKSARSAEIQLYEQALISNAKNNALKEGAVVAHYGMAQIALGLNDLTLALRHVKTATNLAGELANTDPDNAVYQDRLSLSHAILGEVYAYQGQLSDARQALFTSISIGSALRTKNENVARWHSVLAHPKLVLARLEASEGNLVEAESLFAEVSDDLRAKIYSNAADMITMRRYCEALVGKARLSSEAMGLWTEVIAILGPGKKKHGPEALLLLSEAHIVTSQTSNAKAIATKLFDAGYRHPDFVTLLKAYPDLLAEGSKGHAAGI
ncbi:MAG: hypothetical protein DRR42_19765 [Gammaproteobacteria bacterium]|nr:MAG: hypothetical protein DRR42_19765 [Gammaproteobacteria bacterium]